MLRTTACAFLLASLTAATPGLAADSLLIVGAGPLGTWTTTLYIANPTPMALTVEIGLITGYSTGCLPGCPFGTVTVPPNGTVTVTEDESAFTGFPLNTVFITPLGTDVMPIVTATIADTANDCPSIALPVIRLSALQRAAPTTLVFAGAERSADSHCNIVIGGFRRAEEGPDTAPATVHVEVLDNTGQVLADGVFTNGNYNSAPFGFSDLILGDIIGYLGVTELHDGQIRVTSMDDRVLLWGSMVRTRGENTPVLINGANP